MWWSPSFYTRPLLFHIFVNNLNNFTEVLDPVIFAGDKNLLYSDDKRRTLSETANQELNQTDD